MCKAAPRGRLSYLGDRSHACGMTGVQEAIAILDDALNAHQSAKVRVAWKKIRSLAIRGKRISDTTMPRVANLAQHAIYVRESLDVIIPSLPPTLYQTAAQARDHVVAIIDSLSTGHKDSQPPPPPDE